MKDLGRAGSTVAVKQGNNRNEDEEEEDGEKSELLPHPVLTGMGCPER